MGISRSATVVCAYLIATTSMTSKEAIDFVISKRPIVCPNLGFRLQLETYSHRFCPQKKGRLRITSVGESIGARIRKLRRGSGKEPSSPVGEDTQDIPPVTVTMSSVRIDATSDTVASVVET